MRIRWRPFGVPPPPPSPWVNNPPLWICCRTKLTFKFIPFLAKWYYFNFNRNKRFQICFLRSCWDILVGDLFWASNLCPFQIHTYCAHTFFYGLIQSLWISWLMIFMWWWILCSDIQAFHNSAQQRASFGKQFNAVTSASNRNWAWVLSPTVNLIFKKNPIFKILASITNNIYESFIMNEYGFHILKKGYPIMIQIGKISLG